MRLTLALPASLALLLSASDAGAQVTEEIINRGVLSLARPCGDPNSADEILVCGRRDNPHRYRVPLREPSDPGNASRGEIPRASAEPLVGAECGIFQDQRRCSRAEMAEYGYLEGRDPITFVGKVVDAVADPD